jgi:FAD/FMN-containing dehydrogenase
MVLFKQVNYHKDTTLVDVGPGLFWERVYYVLSHLEEPRNVPGASTCQKVGVAGFNLGGGFSNLTNQFGLAIDSIREIEVVIPSGDILTVSADRHDDLFWALKVCFWSRKFLPIVTKPDICTHRAVATTLVL